MGRSFSFARVYDRVFEVLLVAGVLASWRRLDLGSATGIGFRRSAWAHELGRGFATGLAGLAVGLALATLLGGLGPALRVPPGKTLRKALLGAGAAVAITAGEETLFRGVVLRRIRRDAGDALAVLATSLAYAARRVLRARSFAGPVHAWSWVAQTITLFAPLASGAALPQLLGLALLGWLLAVARLRSSGLWLPIGIHAAWVATFRVGRLFFDGGRRPRGLWVRAGRRWLAARRGGSRWGSPQRCSLVGAGCSGRRHGGALPPRTGRGYHAARGTARRERFQPGDPVHGRTLPRALRRGCARPRRPGGAAGGGGGRDGWGQSAARCGREHGDAGAHRGDRPARGGPGPVVVPRWTVLDARARRRRRAGARGRLPQGPSEDGPPAGRGRGMVAPAGPRHEASDLRGRGSARVLDRESAGRLGGGPACAGSQGTTLRRDLHRPPR